MTRLEIRQKFRAENPDVTDRVITDATLNEWLTSANIEICTLVRCITTNESETFDAVVDQQFYDLTALIPKFYDIDDMPGGGVYYDDLSLTKTTPGVLNKDVLSWKTRESGTPKKYWRRGKYLWFDRKPDDTLEIAVDAVLFPDAWTDDAKAPYNELTHLEPFHDGLVKYLQKRTKQKIGKQEEAAIAERDYTTYISWMKRQVKAYSQGAVFFRNAATA